MEEVEEYVAMKGVGVRVQKSCMVSESSEEWWDK